jgi:hypothetical protein
MLLIPAAAILATVLAQAAFAADAAAKADASKPERAIGGTIVDHEGKPVGQALVFWRLQDWLGLLTANAKTDASGQFRIPQPAVGKGNGIYGPGWLWIVTPQKQLSVFPVPRDALQSDAQPLRLTLPQPAALQVTVRDPAGKPLVGAKVSLNRRHTPDADGHGVTQSVPDVVANLVAETTNEHGVVVFPGVNPCETEGLRVTTPQSGQQDCWYGEPSEKTPAREITLRPVGRVKGRLAADSPEGVRGRKIKVSTMRATERRSSTVPSGTAEVVTDEQGRFNIPAIAEGKVSVEVEFAPHDRYLPVSPWTDAGLLQTGGEIDVELPLERGIRVHGIIRESGSGRPLPEIGVLYRIDLEHRCMLFAVLPNPDGRFEFFWLSRWDSPRELGLAVTPFLGGCDPWAVPFWGTECYVGRDRSPDCKELEVPPIEMAQLHGRVVDAAGKSIAHATTADVFSEIEADGTKVSRKLYSPQAKTDDAGRFIAWVNPNQRLRLTITSPGMVAYETDWIQLPHSPSIQLPDVVMTPFRFRAVAGRVVDRQGKPVVGAKVFQTLSGPKPTEATTDAEGRFRLEGVSEESALVFVEKDGWRLSGHVVDGTPASLELVAVRASEPPRRTLKTLPLPRLRAERLTLARQALEAMLKSPDFKQGGRRDLITTFARIDPEQASQLAAKEPKEVQAELLVSIAMATGSPPSMEMIHAVADPMDRVFLAARASTDSRLPKEKTLELLEKAADQVRTMPVPEAECRPMVMAMIAERLFRLGARETAAKLLHDAQAMVKPSSEPGDECSVWGGVAERLALVDLPAALKMIKSVQGQDVLAIHLANVAGLLADHAPAEAERVFGMIPLRDDGTFDRSGAAGLVCGRMAAVDLARARRIAGTVTRPEWSVRLYGAMARTLARKQPAEAAVSLQQALGALNKAWTSRPAGVADQSELVNIAAALVYVAEEVDPRLVEEHLWRCVSMCQPLVFDTPPSSNGMPLADQTPLLATAALVATRYDRALGERLGRAVQTQVKSGSRAWEDETFGLLMLVLDPEQALAELDRSTNQQAHTFIRSQRIELLARTDEAFWERVKRDAIRHLTLDYLDGWFNDD